jgi:hypothetical protein
MNPTPQQIVAGTNVDARMNENFLSVLVAFMYGKKPTTTGIEAHVYGAVFAETIVPDSETALTDNATNYLVAARSNGAVTAATATTNWDDSTNYVRLHKITTSSGAISVWEDHRLDTGGLFGGGSGGALGANLTAIQGLTSAPDTMIRFTGSGTADLVGLDSDPTLGGTAPSDDVIPTQAAVSEAIALAIGTGVDLTQAICIAASDETTALTTGVAKVTFRMPYAFTLTAVRASVTTAPTGGTLLTVDINESGTTILSTKLTFDASEKTTTTATTPAVISDASLANDAEITIDIDAVGSTIAGAGLKVYLIGTKT